MLAGREMLMRRGLAILIFCASVSAIGAGAAPAAKKTPTPSTPAEQSCTAPEFHQFDFWIGEWDVVNSEGKPAGQNRVVSIVNGCALQENWTSASGHRGTSLNVYDEPNRKWHQSWVDDSGGLLQLDGEFRDGRMVLAGRRPKKDRSGFLLHRITWTVVSEDRVQQKWEASGNEGRTWT